MKNIWSFMKLACKTSPVYVAVIMIKAMLSGGKTILNVILPKLLIDELLGDKNISYLILWGVLIICNNVFMLFLTDSLEKYMEVKREWLQNAMVEKMGEKIMNLEYSYLEDPYYLDLKEKAIFAIQNQSCIENMVNAVARTLEGFVTLTGLIVILATLGPVLLIALVVSVLAMLLLYKMSSSAMVEMMQKIIPINRIYGYYSDIATEKPAQKEIRLYDMEEMVTEKILSYSEKCCDEFDIAYRSIGRVMGGMAAISELVSAFTYAYVGLRTISDTFGARLSLGSLTMYVSSAITFSSKVAEFGETIVSLWQSSQYLLPYNEFMALAEETVNDGGVMFTGEVETIAFSHVTFTYPKAEKPVLSDVSFEIHRGEKISIVGLNGAGKSTLVKLICRMYRADSGEIFVNGRNIYDYDYLSYMNTISAIFQDYKLFNFTIAENISCQETGADEERIEHLIDEVGMGEKIAELPNGIYSRFGKEYDEEGIEMSGGQGQKIALARALYKKAGMVILDEPASALDPIAEAEIYEKFNSLVEDKTAIYISHRMSSSVFCDRILIIDGGTVSDFDTHQNLMKKTDSLYYKLFMSQAENYTLAETNP